MMTLCRTLTVCFVILAIPLAGAAEIFKYRDADGGLVFVDDESRIPAEYRDRSTSIAEAQDSLVVYAPEATEDTPAPAALSDEELEPLTQEDKAASKHQTPVEIVGNRVLVPVEVAMGNRIAKVSLLLDTGATTTVLHRQSITNLDLPSGKRYRARVAGGGIVKSEKIRFRHINVGPFLIEKAHVMVINLTGQELPFDGMLGMDFLRSHPYQIDFENELITWEMSN